MFSIIFVFIYYNNRISGGYSMIDMKIMQDASEVVHYDQQDFPVYIKYDHLADYPGMKALCHWHDDLELVYVTEGRMNYYVNGSSLLLNTQDCLFINSRQLHYGHSHLDYDCRFICIRFHPKILGGSPSVYRDYVTPFIENEDLAYLYYDKDAQNHRFIADKMNLMLSLKTKQEDAYELKLISILHSLWHILVCQCKASLAEGLTPDQNDLALQRKMVSYIQEHYQEPLTLDEICTSVNISRSKCCIIFKQYLNQSPIDFLNKYRLEVSCYLLANTTSNVTEIAFSCGFNHLSYFSKIFLREYGCTPTQYRHSRA